MVRGTAIVRGFAIVGFCNGVLISGLSFLLERLGVHAGPSTGKIVLVLVLFPTATLFWEADGGKAQIALALFIASMLNGFLYGNIGVLVACLIAFWRFLFRAKV